MNQVHLLYLSALREVRWQSPNDIELVNPTMNNWLLETGSLSQVLKNNCDELTVELLQNTPITQEQMTDEEIALLDQNTGWSRQVVLKGDGEDWVVGHTIIPEQSRHHHTLDLVEQGEVPIGVTVFGEHQVTRDELQIGQIEMNGRVLMARRSRLWINQKPILVSELFLPNAPCYLNQSEVL